MQRGVRRVSFCSPVSSTFPTTPSLILHHFSKEKDCELVFFLKVSFPAKLNTGAEQSVLGSFLEKGGSSVGKESACREGERSPGGGVELVGWSRAAGGFGGSLSQDQFNFQASDSLAAMSSDSDSASDGEAGPLLPAAARPEPSAGSLARPGTPGPGRAVASWLLKHRVAAGAALAVPVACAVASRHSAVAAFTWQSWATIALTLEALLLMANNLPPDVVMLSVTVMLRLLGVITEEQAWRGFSSPGILAIGVLFVVAKCLEEAGTIELLAGFFLGRTSRPRLAVLQLCVPVALVSSVVNDTPLVAMMIPIVLKWANDNAQPVSWFLLPLSYSALLGGVVTIIGSSTNLVLADLMLNDAVHGHDPGYQLGFFSTTPVALPVALIGVVYMAVVTPALLPPRQGQANGRQGKAAQGAEAKRQDGRCAAGGGHQARMGYEVCLSVRGAAAGRRPAALGLLRVAGAQLCSIRRASASVAVGDTCVDMVALRRGHGQEQADVEDVERHVLERGDVLVFLASPVRPRHVRLPSLAAAAFAPVPCRYQLVL